MNTKQIEQRLARLEDELERVKSELRGSTSRGWRAVVGSHAGSATFDAVVREMRRLRRSDYQSANKEHADREE